MFCRHVFGNLSSGFRGISRFFGEFRGISRKSLNFAGPRPREISEALTKEIQNQPRLKNLNLNLILTCNIYVIVIHISGVANGKIRDSPRRQDPS